MTPERTSHDRFQALGESEEFISLQENISLAARTDRPVIFIGARGTGKELAAARLHLLSKRWNNAYITLNCASLAESLIESELFGHEAGAFTGATRLRKGRFELASGGTLFLDEVANIPLSVQEKILRVVEYGRMERVGGSSTLEIDVRLIAATNVNLKQYAKEGKFRVDLLDRLSFEVIYLPELRRRRDDIMLLADHFALQMARELDLNFTPEFTPRAEQTLLDYPWPGNIRELKNVVERMVYRSEDGEIDEIIFDPFASVDLPEEDFDDTDGALDGGAAGADRATPGADHARGSHPEYDSMDLERAVETLEIRRIRKALEVNQFNQRKAADSLGLSYHQFRGYYRKYRDEIKGE